MARARNESIPIAAISGHPDVGQRFETTGCLIFATKRP